MTNIILFSFRSELPDVLNTEEPQAMIDTVLREKAPFKIHLMQGGERHSFISRNEDRFERQIAVAFIKLHTCQRELKELYRTQFDSLKKIQKRHAW